MKMFDGQAGWRVSLIILCLAFGHAVAAVGNEKGGHDWQGDFDTSEIPPDNPYLEEAEVEMPRAFRDSVHTELFTDSTGRTLLYRYGIPDGVNTNEPQPVLVRFHGNSTATREQILNGFGSVANLAEQYGLMPVVVTSPETRWPPQEEIRQWYPEDRLMIHEFLSEQLPDHFQVDFDRIYFDGASQGTCFLHDFMQEYGEHYGGGFYGGCGCYNSPDPTWDPPDDFLQNMKVFINTTTGDFLYEPSLRGYAYYKYTIGTDTRGDLYEDGAHCVRYSAGRQLALDWFTGVTDIPEEPFEPHWGRVSPQSGVAGLGLDGTGSLWKAVYDDSADQSFVSRSQDQGETWEQSYSSGGEMADIEAHPDGLFMILDDELFRSLDSGQSFQSIEPAWYTRHVMSDGDGVVYRRGNDGVGWSSDAGDTWQTFAGFSGWIVNPDSALDVENPRIVAHNSGNNRLHLGNANDGEMVEISDTPSGHPFSAAWDGTTLWALAPSGSNYELYRAVGPQGPWQSVDLPDDMSSYGASGTDVTALDEGVVLIRGAFRSSWMSSDDGGSWTRVLGLETGVGGAIVSLKGDIFYSDGDAVFRLNLVEPVDVIFFDDFRQR